VAVCGYSEISGNFIQSTGGISAIYLNNPTSTTAIRNNCMYTTGENTGAIDITGGLSVDTNLVFIQNNSMYCDLTCIAITNMNPNIDNNLFFYNGSSSSYMITDPNTDSVPKSIKNNYFGTGGLILDGYELGSHKYYSHSDVIPASEVFITKYTGNIWISLYSTFITTYFTSFSSTDASTWHLNSSATAFTTTGLDLSNPAICSIPFNTDFDGKTRPSGSGTWSLGAFQYP
jgi:hypothetical protein